MANTYIYVVSNGQGSIGAKLISESELNTELNNGTIDPTKVVDDPEALANGINLGATAAVLLFPAFLVEVKNEPSQTAWTV